MAPRIASPPLPKILGRHYACSRPSGVGFRWKRGRCTLHGEQITFWQFLGWQLAVWHCPGDC